jgi:DNA primase large subunit
MAVRGAPTVANVALWTEYPFLPGAESLIADLAPSLSDLLTGAAFARARELGRARVRAAAEDPSGKASLGELPRATAEERFLSFQYARLLLSAAASTAPARRWAVAEAKRAGDQLAAMARTSRDSFGLIARSLGFGFEDRRTGYAIPLAEYLRLAGAIREAEFRLVHQPLRAGWIEVRDERAARLLEEGIRLALTGGLPVPLDSEVRARLETSEAGFLRELAQLVPAPTVRRGAAVLRAEFFPPCIRKMRRMLESGENLSHSGRFALAAFLHRAGADFDTIVDAYRGAPDFDESITRYQVEHITQREGGRGYEPPTCETLRSHGLCFRDGDPSAPSAPDRERDELCWRPFLQHPFQYYRIKGGAAVEKPPSPGATSAAGPKASRPSRAEGPTRPGAPG